MLRAAIGFFIFGLVAMALGATGFAGLSLEIGRTLLYVFLILAVVSFLVSLIGGRKGKMNSFIWLAFCASAGLAVGCSSMKNESDRVLSTPSAESKAAAHQEGAANLSEVNFEKGSFVLTAGAREALKQMTDRTKNTGEVTEIKILAWSDADYPSDSRRKLSKADRDLADQRLNSIRDYVKQELAIKNIKTYNMAERPNAFARVFDTSDARTKNTFEKAGVTSSDGKSLTGNASRAIVMAMVAN